jgi:hypothetical protein
MMGENKMKTVTKQQESIEALRLQIKPGDIIWKTVRHVSRSGMYRAIDAYVIHDSEMLRYSWAIANAIGARYDKNHEAIGMSGCGMDMRFEVVYLLGQALFPEGFECVGDKCPSNDHSNGDRDRTPHHHESGGYALINRSF